MNSVVFILFSHGIPAAGSRARIRRRLEPLRRRESDRPERHHAGRRRSPTGVCQLDERRSPLRGSVASGRCRSEQFQL